jgi:hypothetical protein
MSPTIRVDDEVYALLQARAEAFIDTPNTVLRRILELEPSATTTANRPMRRGEGASRKLVKMIEAGLIEADTELVWERRNNGERFTARLDGDGRLHLEDGHVAESPSAAARHLTGYEVNGWRVWRDAEGTALGELWGGRDARRGRGGPRPDRRGERREGPRGERRRHRHPEREVLS